MFQVLIFYYFMSIQFNIEIPVFESTETVITIAPHCVSVAAKTNSVIVTENNLDPIVGYSETKLSARFWVSDC